MEERSAAVLLAHVLPKALGPNVSWSIHSFSGKQDLLRKLPQRLRGYKSRLIWQDLKIVVLLDRDTTDCIVVKDQLEQIATSEGLATKSSGNPFTVVNRIAVEELEAWYFGDIPALRRLYPRVPQSLGARAKYRDPDGIAGGTWETLERLLQGYGYEQGGLRKVALANSIGPLLDLDRNSSKSFNVFIDGLQAAAA